MPFQTRAKKTEMLTLANQNVWHSFQYNGSLILSTTVLGDKVRMQNEFITYPTANQSPVGQYPRENI